MNALLCPVGSHGDVHPFIALGQALRRRGHRVTVITAAPFRGAAEDAGLAFVPTGTAEDYRAAVDDPDLWHPTRSLGVLFERDRYARMLREAYAAIAERYTAGDTALVGGTLSVAARLAREALGVPLATLHLQPMALASVDDPPAFAAFAMKRWWPRPLRRLVYWAGDRKLVDPYLAPPLNELRAELGLKPITRVFGPWRHSPDRVLCAFPAWFASAPDYPAHARHVGFLRYDQAGTHTLAPALRELLASGEKPVVISLGSAMRHAAAQLKAFAEAFRGRPGRGLILARSGPQIPADLPENVTQVDYAPFSEVFPRAAAVVHHGGVGTAAQCLAAGVPQVVVPMAYDQPDNAARLGRMGVARTVWPKRLTPDSLRKALDELRSSDLARASCIAFEEKMAREPDAATRAADEVEALLEPT